MGAIVDETGVVKLHRLMERQIGQRGRQPGKSRGGGAADEDRHHVCLAGKSGRDLVNDIIFLAVRSALPEYLEPARADHDQYDRAPHERLIDGLGKVLTRADVLHIHEDAMDAQECAEAIGNAAGVSSRVVAPIADEDVVRGGRL